MAISRKVYIFIDSLVSGGAERFTVCLSAHLARAGVSTTVVTQLDEGSDFFQVPRGVQRAALGWTAGPSLTSKVQTNIKRVAALRALVRRDRPDVVVGMMTPSAIMAILACLGLSTRVVVAERNFPGRKKLVRPWSLLRMMLYRLADCHVAQTSETAAWVEKRAGARKVCIIPNPIAWPADPVEPSVSPDDWLPAGRRLIMAAGTKVEQKGFDLLIDAFSDIARRCPGWDLAIAGVTNDGRQGDARNRLLRQAQDKEVGDRVHLPGLVGNIFEWYERADIFVLSSRYEGFPNVLLEAMASGCACIAYDCDTGPRDIIKHELNGLLVDAENKDALAGEMLRLVDDPGLRARLREAAKEVRGDFSESHILARWEEVLGCPRGRA